MRACRFGVGLGVGASAVCTDSRGSGGRGRCARSGPLRVVGGAGASVAAGRPGIGVATAAAALGAWDVGSGDPEQAARTSVKSGRARRHRDLGGGSMAVE